MKIVIFEFEEWEHQYFQSLVDENEVIFEKEALDEDTIEQYKDEG